MKDKIKKRLMVLLTGIGVIFFWRGCWNFLDMYFIPSEPILSNLLCLFIGLIAILFANYTHFKF